MSDNIARDISGMGYYEAISIFLDGIDTVFNKVQLSSHANLTNVFSIISVTRANDSQTVFHDVSLLPMRTAISNLWKPAILRRYSALPN